MHNLLLASSVRLVVPYRLASVTHGFRRLSTGIMTRTSAQGRRKDAPAAGAAAATATTEPAAEAPKFSPALTTIDPSQYDAQLEAKVERVRAQFVEFNPPPLQAFRSRPEHYRMRWVGRGDPVVARPIALRSSCVDPQAS